MANTQQIFAKYAEAQINFKHNCLIDTKDLSLAQVNCLFDLAKFYQNNIHEIQNLYPANQLVYSATLFYEASTRTKTSFNIALTNLGLKPINLDISTSSHTKGESLHDTLLTLKAMNVNMAIIRHSSSGVLDFILENYPDLKMKLINAGDGSHAHPTQALLDAFTLLELETSLKNKKIVIVGDILHSRVARSNIHLLNLLGADIHLAGPETLLPLSNSEIKATIHHDLNTALTDADFVMALRIQFERQNQGFITSVDDYVLKYQINKNNLKLAKAKVKVLHPGPVNRNIELADDIINDQNISLIQNQVANGIPIRMACIAMLLQQNN